MYFKRSYKGQKNLTEVRKSVQKFLEDDLHSHMCPGKKDTITRGRMKMQRRVLLDSLKHLHRKYINNGGTFMSYTQFCLLRPFWVVQPTLKDRETCLCVLHCNTKELLKKLHLYRVIKESTTKDICNTVCCKRSYACMFRICQHCKEKKLKMVNQTNEFKNCEVKYSKWIKTQKITQVKGEEKKVKITSKIVIQNKAATLLEELNKVLPVYLKHIFIIEHQNNQRKHLIMNLSPNEILLHIDFSENYALKYYSEVQAAHFGASKKQLSLHTGVLYFEENTKDLDKNAEADDGTKNLSFCTVSENLDHGAHAVWAHLKPILEELVPNNVSSKVYSVHFWSDGPGLQYKNLFNFFYLTELLPILCPSIKRSTWNFSAAGHGKRAMDGVGGALKRMADTLIARGTDITDSDSFLQNLKKTETTVKLYKTENTDIANNLSDS
ncbi:hypothetical protein AVEN_252291-1 [Araneus ventricosus]|uniref:Uncharacterized protein n=1 Tax=Araneus ventricosus TaxID=182803 RepID=A0A4Y2DNW7_ARAVE|nr:hypothetical protein AVEN_252291-1 [Araneus ventricosus]